MIAIDSIITIAIMTLALRADVTAQPALIGGLRGVGTPIYDALVAETFNPAKIAPTPQASDLIAKSYLDYDRRHAKNRLRDEHGRFIPRPTDDELIARAED